MLLNSVFKRRQIDPPILNREELNKENLNIKYLQDYANKLLESQTKEDNNILSILKKSYHEHRITKHDMINQIVFLLIANLDTTPNTICNSLGALYQHPDQFDFLQNNPILTPEVTNELLRYDTAVQMMNNGQFIAKGEKVIAVL